MGEEARAQELFNKQKAYFASDATKSYEWRIDQLDRLTRMLKDNYKRFCDASSNDFKTAVQENVFEVSASRPVSTRVDAGPDGAAFLGAGARPATLARTLKCPERFAFRAYL